MRRLGLCLMTLACGCTDGAVTSADLGPVADLGAGDLLFAPRDPTDHPPAPKVASSGGPVIAAMELQTIVWPGDEELGQSVQEFHTWMLTSSYWSTIVGEYGVGAGTARPLLVMPSAAPKSIADTDFDGIVQKLITDGTIPAPTANTVLAFVLPAATSSSLNGSKGCVDYDGYHSEALTQPGGKTYLPFAVVLQCPTFGDDPFDTLTVTLSHEAAEAATDPYPYSKPAYGSNDPGSGGEVADLCSDLSAMVAGPDGGVADGYVVTRSYSAKRAATGDQDPCVPSTGPYFNAVLDPNAVKINIDSTRSVTTVVKLEPFAYGQVGKIAWQISGADGYPGVTMSPEFGVNNAGDTVAITITIGPDAQPGPYPLNVSAEAQAGGTNESWAALNVR